MTEQSLPAPGERAIPHGTPAPGRPATVAGPEHVEQPPTSLFVMPRPVPRVVIKADLLPAVSVLSTVSLLGFPIGWLWSRLAPPQRVQVIPDGRLVPLPTGSLHRFDDLAVFLLLTLAAGIAIGMALWMLRQRRGPVILIAGVLGSVLGAWLAARMGLSFAAGLHPAPSALSVGDVFAQAPRLESPWAVIAQPLMVAIVYGIAAAWNGMDDLGRRLTR